MIKILVAGDPSSIHTARFVDLLQSAGFNVRIFQSEYYYRQDELLRNVKIYVSHFTSKPINGNVLLDPSSFENASGKGFYGFIKKSTERLIRKLYGLGIRNVYGRGICYSPGAELRALELAKIIYHWNPAIVFSLKMQNDGYTVAEAKKILGLSFIPKWIHFNWGTDIEFFGKHIKYIDEHLPRIKCVLSLCDFHIADCKRDAIQAFEFGFQGKSLGTCLANGGYDLDEISKFRKNSNANRNLILIKGRQGGLVGKAFNVLEALHRIPHIAREYKIIVVLADEKVEGATNFLAKIDNLNCEVVSRLPYESLMNLFSKSRIAISASDVDGTPSFLTEAMAMGALPIHSDMDSVREWIEDGHNGLLFPVDDIDKLVYCINRAHNDHDLFVSSQAINWRITCDRMNRNVIRKQIVSIINEVLTD